MRAIPANLPTAEQKLEAFSLDGFGNALSAANPSRLVDGQSTVLVELE